MKKSGISRGTLFLILMPVTLITLIIATCRPPLRHEQFADDSGRPYWSDTLTNRASDMAVTKGLDNEITRFMSKWNLKGISFAVMRNDSLLYAKGYGWADREAGDTMEATSIMRVASVSKLVTAVAVMKLCELGQLSLSDKVFGEDGILNDTTFTNAIRDQRIREITVDHLLLHKGGFGRGAGDPMFNTRDIMAARHLDTPPTNEELTRIVLGRKLAFMPGAGRRYSNFGYMLLSLVIERVTGRSYWDFVTEEVLEPAGVHNLRPATNYYIDRHPGEVKYYAPDDELVEEYNGSGRMVSRVYGGSNVSGLLGAGGWLASAADLARLVAAIDNQPGVEDVLSPVSVAAMTEHIENDNMSRGWSEVGYDGRWIRTGTLSSTHALIERFPEGDCWVILTNTGVWTGLHFSRELSRLTERLRARHSASLPRRNLW